MGFYKDKNTKLHLFFVFVFVFCFFAVPTIVETVIEAPSLLITYLFDKGGLDLVLNVI